MFLANIDPALQLEVLEQVAQAALRRLRHHELLDRRASAPDLLRLLERVDMLLLNDEEARQLSGEAQPAGGRARDPRAWARTPWSSSAATRARCCSTRAGVFAAPAFPLENVVDPTGAGDSFAGGFMGWLAHAGGTTPPRRSAPR